jgi:hypothetical protein
MGNSFEVPNFGFVRFNDMVLKTSIALLLLIAISVGQSPLRSGLGRNDTSIEQMQIDKVKKQLAHQEAGWDDTIIPGSPVTVLELAQKVIPDLDIDEKKSLKIMGKDLSNVRLLDGVDETGMELDLDTQEEHEFTGADYLWMKDHSEKLLVLILSVDIERPVITLFKVGPQIKLLDSVTMAQDAHVTVDAKKVWTIHPQHQAFVVQCWHDNSSESYDSYTFVSVIRGRLRAIAGPITSTGFTQYSSARRRVCKTSTTSTFKFNRSQRGGYFDLIETDETMKVCHRESEEWSWKTGIVSKRTARVTYGWNSRVKQYRRSSAKR